MSEVTETNLPAGSLFHPVKTPFNTNSGLLEVSGWCQDSFRRQGFQLCVRLGKRCVRFPLDTIPFVTEVMALKELDEHPRDSDYWFFKAAFKIGKGLKHLSFSIEHEDGRSEPLGKQMVFQKDRVLEQVSTEENLHDTSKKSDYEEWLIHHEPLLRSARDFSDSELVFPLPLVWVIRIQEGTLQDVLTTIQAIDRGKLGDQSFVLLDSDGIFESKNGSKLLGNLLKTGSIRISSEIDLNRVLGELASDSWVCFLKEGDIVASHFQEDFFKYLSNHSEIEFFYSDYDFQLATGGVGDCHISPAWNRDLLQSYPYIGDTFLMKTEVFLGIGGLGREVYHQLWALQLKFSRQRRREQIGRLCGVYFHLKNKDNPHSCEEANVEGTELLQSHQDALGNTTQVSLAPGIGGWRTRYQLPAAIPKVSLLIPTRDGVSVLKTTVDSILEKTTYPDFEILILDNDSEEKETHAYFEELKEKGCRIISCPGRFNYSQINNRGSMEAEGEILGFLNNDLEVTDGEWLDEMVSHVCRKDVGAVGAKLLYPDDTLQHAGVLIGVGHVAAHAFRLFENSPEQGPLRAHLIQNYSAVTAACLLMRTEVFKEVGGFDDAKLAITNNDVDLCIKAREAGYRNVYTPYAVLYHHESATRGPEDTPEKFNRYQKEVNHMWKVWSEILMNDPAYNRLLTRFKEDFSLAGSEELQKYIPGKIF